MCVSGCIINGYQEGGILQLMEGFHTLLRTPWPTHRPHLHLPRTTQQILQEIRIKRHDKSGRWVVRGLT